VCSRRMSARCLICFLPTRREDGLSRRLRPSRISGGLSYLQWTPRLRQRKRGVHRKPSPYLTEEIRCCDPWLVTLRGMLKFLSA
jgi:hypothetical protein